MFERDKERPNILGQIQGKEVTDHEIFGLDSDGYCDVAYRGTFHGGNANTVTLALKIRKMLGVLFERDGGYEISIMDRGYSWRLGDCGLIPARLCRYLAAKNNEVGVEVIMVLGA